MLHNFGDTEVRDLDAQTFDRFTASQADYHLSTVQGRRMIAEQYVGVPYQSLDEI